MSSNVMLLISKHGLLQTLGLCPHLLPYPSVAWCPGHPSSLRLWLPERGGDTVGTWVCPLALLGLGPLTPCTPVSGPLQTVGIDFLELQVCADPKVALNQVTSLSAVPASWPWVHSETRAGLRVVVSDLGGPQEPHRWPSAWGP